MPLKKLFAQVNCTDLVASECWYTSLFGRAPDERPMEGLAEWHHENHAGLQLFLSPEHAGHGSVTLIVEDLHSEHRRLKQAGLAPGEIEPATTTSLVRLRDLDGNLVVLAEPGNA